MNYPFNADNIPLALKIRKQWLVWRFEKQGERITKVPYQTTSQGIGHKYAKTNDPKTLTDFETCLQALKSGRFDGIGFAFCKDDGLAGIDLDHCIDKDGCLEQWAQDIVGEFTETYVERSPSGDGLHIWCSGVPVETGEKKWKKPGTNVEQGIEVYCHRSARYFTVTGDVVSNFEITERQPGLDWVYQQYWAEQYEEPKQVRSADGELDSELICKALDYIPADNYKSWIVIGMALKAGGLDVNVWETWSQKSSKFESGLCTKKWATFKDSKVGLGILFSIAKQHGFRFPEQEPPDWTKPETFGEPLLFGEIETPEINIDFLPSWVKNYVEAVAAHTQTPPGAVAMLALAILGTCVQKRFEVSPYQDDNSYTEPLSIWCLVMLPPASRKTAILDALRSPVVSWERDKAVELQPEISKQITERNVMVSRIQELTKQAARAEQLGEEDE